MRSLTYLCAAFFFGLTAAAIADSTNSSWFARTWQTEDGLPDNNINSLAQGPDGFLWVGTPLGLMRFDGVTFDGFSFTNTVGEANRGVAALLQNHSGGLWMGMDRGAVLDLNTDKVTAFIPHSTPLDSAPQTMVEGDDGRLWISYAGGAVCYLKDSKPSVLSTQFGLPWSSISSVAKDTQGRIWIARNGEVGIFRAGRFEPLVQPGDRAIRLAAARAGGIWICAGTQLLHCDEAGHLEKIGQLAAGNSHIEASVIIEDHEGAVWVGTAYDGLFRFDGTRFEKISTSHPEISCLLEDSEGNIWVGTHGGGLNRLRRRAITLENVQNGLPFEAVQSLCEDTHGTLWAVTGNGFLARRGANQWETISTNTDWPGGIATCVAADPDGSIWIGTRNYRLIHLENGRFDVWDKSRGLGVSPITVLMTDHAGNLWIGGVNHTMQFLNAGHLTDVPLREDTHSIRAIAQDPTGAIWIGTSRGLLLRINGTSEINEAEKTSGVAKSIRSLYVGSDGSLWIGYAGFGLGRFKAGHFSQITAAQGLFDDYISQIVSDGHGWFWFGANHGIFKINERELIEASENTNAHVHSILYGRGEGLPSLEADSGFMPSSTRTRDGRIWIPTQSALVVVNPQSSDINSNPPPVFLKRVIVDGKIVAAYSGPFPLDQEINLRKPVALQVPPNHHKIEFDFTALDFSAPESVRLQYQLEGWDDEWIDANPERNVSYSRLPAGNYRFRVRASNSDGVWNEGATSLLFTVTPFLWQQKWFQLLAFTLFAAIMIVSVRYISFRRLRSRLRALEQQTALYKERTRIARDLHDDLGSYLTKIVLLSDLMVDYRRDPDKSSETAQQVSTAARQVIKTLDETVWAINPRNDTLPHLIDYIGQFAVEFLRAAGIRCHVDMPVSVPEKNVSTEVRHNLFLVVKEALNNVVSHAKATEVCLKITTGERMVCIIIEDNGRGFTHAPDNACADGLRNMRQRIEELGGEFDLQTKPAAGTRIAVTTPLNR